MVFAGFFDKLNHRLRRWMFINAFRQLSEAKQRSMRYASGEKKSYTKITFGCTIELFRPIAQRDVIHSEILGVVSL